MTNKGNCPPKKKKKSVTLNQISEGKSIVDSSNNTEQAMGNHFQEEIIMEILSRLPGRSLLRFKCVSRFWKTLISQPFFTMKHLNHAKNDHNSQKFLISQRCHEDRKFSSYYCSFSVEEVRELDFPLDSKPWHCVICCCCDGLALIEVSDNVADEHPTLLLWNPSTGESVVLPYPKFPSQEYATMGLGYDSSSGDYKILKIYENKDDGDKVPSEILALKCGSWRKIDKHPRGICNVLSGMHSLASVHGAFHWIGTPQNNIGTSRNYSVVSFSISNEVYGEIPLPICLTTYHFDNIDVSVLKEMLCFCSTSIYGTEDNIKLWVMNEYGDKESWSPLFTIGYHGMLSAIPKYMFPDDEVVFWCLHTGCRGNSFETSRGPFALWPQSDTIQNGFAFTESLISPKLLSIFLIND